MVPCIILALCGVRRVCTCMHALVYLFVWFILRGEGGEMFFFSSNIDMILIVFIIDVILFLWLRLLYHDKSLPFSFFCGEGKIYCDSLIWSKEIKIKHFRKMFDAKEILLYLFFCTASFLAICVYYTYSTFILNL